MYKQSNCYVSGIKKSNNFLFFTSFSSDLQLGLTSTILIFSYLLIAAGWSHSDIVTLAFAS